MWSLRGFCCRRNDRRAAYSMRIYAAVALLPIFTVAGASLGAEFVEHNAGASSALTIESDSLGTVLDTDVAETSLGQNLARSGPGSTPPFAGAPRLDAFADSLFRFDSVGTVPPPEQPNQTRLESRVFLSGSFSGAERVDLSGVAIGESTVRILEPSMYVFEASVFSTRFFAANGPTIINEEWSAVIRFVGPSGDPEHVVSFSSSDEGLGVFQEFSGELIPGVYKVQTYLESSIWADQLTGGGMDVRVAATLTVPAPFSVAPVVIAGLVTRRRR